MLRQIINIDKEKCDGCGLCIPECKEGAIQIIDGKAHLISDLFCDGLGACLGYCPQEAITIEEREAEPYSELKVMESIGAGSAAVLEAHLVHLIEHNELEYYLEACNYMAKNHISNPLEKKNVKQESQHHAGCPGSRTLTINQEEKTSVPVDNSSMQSELKQWPVQLHLVRPDAPYFRNSELVIMSSCGPVASPMVHPNYMRGRSIVIACPKLDNTEPYIEKLASIFQNSKTQKAIVVIMEVPCCRGLAQFAVEAANISENTNLTIEQHVLSLEGELISKSIIFESVKKMINV